jgi:hypothetical protein
VHRRDFNFGYSQNICRSARSPAPARSTVRRLDRQCTPPAIAALYKNAIVIDSLCAPFIDMDAPPKPADTLRAVQQSGITAINFTISDPTFEGTVGNIGAAVEALVEQHPEAFLIVRRHSDIARAKRENKIGIMPGFQYTAFLEENPERIELFRRSACASCSSPTTIAASSAMDASSPAMPASAKRALPPSKNERPRRRRRPQPQRIPHHL